MGIIVGPEGATHHACSNHPERRVYAQGRCQSCYQMGRRSGSLPVVQPRGRMADCHPERRHYSRGMCQTCWARTYRASGGGPTAEQVADYDYRRKYGMTAEQVAIAVAERGGRCDLCHRTRRLHVDHNHRTGAFRGMLCVGCNTALGRLEDNVVAVVAYLKKGS